MRQLLFGAIAVLLSSAVFAQDSSDKTQSEESANQTSAPKPAETDTVSLFDLSSGLRATMLVGESVYGPNNEDLGDVTDTIIHTKGQAVALLIEGEGFLGIAGSQHRIAWSELEVNTAENIRAPQLKKDSETLETIDADRGASLKKGEFRASALLAGEARVEDEVGYRPVRDIVMNKKGKVIAVLIDGDASEDDGSFERIDLAPDIPRILFSKVAETL